FRSSQHTGEVMGKTKEVGDKEEAKVEEPQTDTEPAPAPPAKPAIRVETARDEEIEDVDDVDAQSFDSRGSISTISESLPPIPYYPPSLPPPPSPARRGSEGEEDAHQPASQQRMLDPPPLFSRKSQRLRIGLILMLGLYVVVSMRLNLSMAVVCMVNSTAFPSTARSDLSSHPNEAAANAQPQQCQRTAQDMASQGYNGTLLWSPQMQSILFSATFYGSLATITVSGAIADKFGPKAILGGAASVYIIVTLATPFLSQHSYLAYFLSRLVMGLAEGFVFPCLGSMAGRWFPPNERSTMAAIYTSGNQLAASLSSVISAGLCASPLGWPAIFYLFGALGIMWLIGWCVVATNVPDENAFISVRETLYLREAIQRKRKVGSVPWRAMLRSTPIYACLSAQFAFNFTATIMQGFLPTYFRDELLLPLGQNGIYTTIPFISQLVTKNIISIVADKLKQKRILEPTQCAVLFQTISSFGAAISMICLATVPSCERPWLAAVFLALYGAFFSAGIPGFFTSLLSIAPQYSGTMTSVGMTAGSIANVLGPLWLSLVMLMKTRYTWPIVFFTGGLLNVVAGIIFYLFGDATVQNWAKEGYGQEKAPPLTPSAIHSVEKAIEDAQINPNTEERRPRFTLNV
ncbi:slc-17.3, partial [Pristionchus pacificus]